MNKIILITGASSGIGLACANALAAHGHTVFGSSRDLKKLEFANFIPVKLDVTEPASIEAVYEQILARYGRLDVLINNAGSALAGPTYATPMDRTRYQFEVNFFGVLAVSNMVLPEMILKKKGLIVNISSLAGLFGLPYQGMYSASKYALEGYSQSLRMELRNTGVKVVLINPGDFKSGLTLSREKTPFALDNPELKAQYLFALKAMERDETKGMDPQALAKKIVDIVACEKPDHRYLVGSFGERIVPVLKCLLPSSWFENLMNHHYGITSRSSKQWEHH